MVPMSSAAASAAQTKLSEVAFFSIHAGAEPGVMPRILEHFAKRGLVPSRWHSAVSATDQSRLRIEIEMHGLDPDITEYIASCLRQIVSVETVLTIPRDHSH
jgi:acetolactate synthase small subunit